MLTRSWARRGSRPTALRDQRTKSAYIFGAICPARGVGAGLVLLGHARRFRAEIVNYADDFCVLGKAPAAEMLTAVERLVAGLKLTVNERKTRCLRCPEEPLEFLGYRIGRNYRPYGKVNRPQFAGGRLLHVMRPYLMC